MRQTLALSGRVYTPDEHRGTRAGKNTHATGNRTFVQGRFAERPRLRPLRVLPLHSLHGRSLFPNGQGYYRNSGAVGSTINGRKGNTKGNLQTRTIPVIEDLRSLLTFWRSHVGQTYLGVAELVGK
jgi:hypothetical protein